MMDRTIIQRHLDLSESHVEIGARNIDSQRRIVAELEQDGHDTQRSRRLLQLFEQLQAMHIADRDRLRQELAQADTLRNA